MDPVAQGLSIHPAGRRCLSTRGTLQDMRYGESPAGNAAVVAPRRTLPQGRRR
jgi:hypothetical protein